MSQASDMLRRLDGTSTYADLQQVFAQLTGEAETGRENPELAAKIDEVIERLIRERARDEQELGDVQSRYESFREQNRGVVGWFKRKLPFTETRKQESEHLGELADQLAEILADNLVIARAQMLKERILPPNRRRLGQRIADWQNHWELNRTSPSAAARILVQLQAELGPSQAFVTELQKDIAAFKGAKFRDQADVQRRDSDLAAAGRELDSLNQEIQAKLALKSSSLKLLAGQLAAELAATDTQFKQDGQQLERIESAHSRLNEMRTSFAKLVATVGQVAGVAKKLQSLPEQVQQARQAISRLETERAGAVQLAAAKSLIVQERQSRHTETQRMADQAKQMLASLQPSYDAHLAQRAASASMPQPVEAEPLAPIAQQFQLARGSMDQAQARLQEALSALDAAKREASQAEANIKAVDDKLAAEHKKLSEVEKQEPPLRSELAGHNERGQREFAAAASALAAYLLLERTSLRLPPYHPDEIAAGTSGYLGTRGLEPSFANALLQPTTNVTRQVQASTALDRLVQWQDSQQRLVEQEQSQLRSRRESLWKQRCSQLLGDQLAEEACHGGLTSG